MALGINAHGVAQRLRQSGMESVVQLAEIGVVYVIAAVTDIVKGAD
ncbi:hypothetical protein N2384_01945 [Bacillus paralicheniformis]|nr:hypothetical protein [Bacillus paralicheniformis]UWS61982.1 hypothetical protein N2384_01945 [Bacillus paralicheniformis]